MYVQWGGGGVIKHYGIVRIKVLKWNLIQPKQKWKKILYRKWWMVLLKPIRNWHIHVSLNDFFLFGLFVYIFCSKWHRIWSLYVQKWNENLFCAWFAFIYPFPAMISVYCRWNCMKLERCLCLRVFSTWIVWFLVFVCLRFHLQQYVIN